MSDRSTFDPFERLIAAELERYVSVAVDPKPASSIAAEAMKPRGLTDRMGTRRARRILLLGLAATLLVPIAYFAAVNRPTPQVQMGTYLGVLVRRTESPDPGIDIWAARQDGAERLVRHVPDSVLGNGNTLSEYGVVSETGWIALAASRTPWPMVLVNLRDGTVPPWVVAKASVSAIGPKWGPTGLLAAPRGIAGIVIVDTEQHTVEPLTMHAGLPGGGPSIAWTADGAGVLGVVPDSSGTDGNRFVTVPLAGGANIEGIPVLDDREFAGAMGLGPQLRVCPLLEERDEQCPGESAGAIELVQPDGSATTVYRAEQSPDHALSARFTAEEGTYWALFDHDSGRQLIVRKITPQGVEDIATIDRAADWEHPGLAWQAPDDSIIGIDVVRHDYTSVDVLVPTNREVAPSSGTGHFAGFMAVDDVEVDHLSDYGPNGAPLEAPQGGEQYRLPTLHQLIAEEVDRNPGRTVLARGSRDGSAQSTGSQTDQILAEDAGQGDFVFYCVGSQPATVRLNGRSIVTTSCLQPWGVGPPTWLNYKAGDVLEVEAARSASWRLLVFLDQ